MQFERLMEFWSAGLEEALGVDFDIQLGRFESLTKYIRKNECWIHPVVGETILKLLEGTHQQHQLVWSRSKRLNPKQKTLLETVKRDFELAKQVARRGGFQRGMYARVCHEVGAEQTPKLSGHTVQKLVRPLRDNVGFAAQAERSRKK